MRRDHDMESVQELAGVTSKQRKAKQNTWEKKLEPHDGRIGITSDAIIHTKLRNDADRRG